MLDAETRDLLDRQQQMIRETDTKLGNALALIRNLLESEDLELEVRKVHLEIAAASNEIINLFSDDRKLMLDSRKVLKAIRGDGDLVDAPNKNTEDRKPLFEAMGNANDKLEPLMKKKPVTTGSAKVPQTVPHTVIPPKSVAISYILWMIGGFGALGFHRFFLGKIVTGII